MTLLDQKTLFLSLGYLGAVFENVPERAKAKRALHLSKQIEAFTQSQLLEKQEARPDASNIKDRILFDAIKTLEFCLQDKELGWDVEHDAELVVTRGKKVLGLK